MLPDSPALLHDSELVTRSRHGDRAAFAALYDRHHKTIYGYFRARVLDRRAAEELTRQAFFEAFDSLSRDQASARFYTWIVQIARRLVRAHAQEQSAGEAAWAELCLASDKAMQDYDASEDYLPVIPVCMKRLDDTAVRVLEWHYREGLSLEVIAERLGQSAADVKQRLVRARSELRRCVQRHLGSATA